jgi:hypothetical protein
MEVYLDGEKIATLDRDSLKFIMDVERKKKFTPDEIAEAENCLKSSQRFVCGHMKDDGLKPHGYDVQIDYILNHPCKRTLLKTIRCQENLFQAEAPIKYLTEQLEAQTRFLNKHKKIALKK